MRILYFAPHEPWPLTSGARLRDYHFARQLAKKAAVTFVGVRNAEDPDTECPAAFASFERVITIPKRPSYTVGNIVRGLIGPKPITILNLHSTEIAGWLREFLQEGHFDTVQIEGVQLGDLYLDLFRHAPSRPAVISDWHNLEWEIMWRYSERSGGLRRIVARRTATLLEHAERSLLTRCDICIMASQRELEKAQQRWGMRGQVHVIPNGVDCDYYSVHTECSVGRASDYVLFVGSMDYHANVDAVTWFAREVWPVVRLRHPSLEFVIVGRNPPPEVRGLAGGGISVTGTVDDVRPYYAGARMVVVPLRVGSGTRLKILEAMAAGVPVLSSTIGAEGLDVTPQEDVILADSAGEIADAVSNLMSDREVGARLAGNAKALVRTRYDWSILGNQLFNLHEGVLDRVKRGRPIST